MRFALFSGSLSYPSGGWKDYRGSFETAQGAKDWLLHHAVDSDWWHIVDLEKNVIVEECLERKYVG